MLPSKMSSASCLLGLGLTCSKLQTFLFVVDILFACYCLLISCIPVHGHDKARSTVATLAAIIVHQTTLDLMETIRRTVNNNKNQLLYYYMNSIVLVISLSLKAS